MNAPARTGRRGTLVSLVATGLRWAMRLAAAGTVGAAVAPIALTPEAFIACLPPGASGVDLPCLGEAGLGLAAALGVLAVALAVLSALARGYQQRLEDRLLVAEVRAAAARFPRDSA